MKNREFIFYFPTGKSVKIQISDNSRTTEDTLKKYLHFIQRCY